MPKAMRECGERHIGVCSVERANRWNKPGAWVPPEYREERTISMKRPHHLADIHPNRARLQEQVGIAIGRASVTWSEPSPGIYDSETASELVDDLMLLVERFVDADNVHLRQADIALGKELTDKNVIIGNLQELIRQLQHETKEDTLKRLVREFSQPAQANPDEQDAHKVEMGFMAVAEPWPGVPSSSPLPNLGPRMHVRIASEDGLEVVEGNLPAGEFTLRISDPE